MHKDHPLYGFKYKSSAKNGDMYKKDNEFYFLEVERKNGKREGKAVMTKVGDNSVIAKLNYKNDKLNGKCTRYYEDRVFECTLKDDILDGPFSEYDLDGNLICEGVYENGERKEERFSSTKRTVASAAAAAMSAPWITGPVTELLFTCPLVAPVAVACYGIYRWWNSGNNVSQVKK